MDPLEAHLLGQTTQRLSFWHEVRASFVTRRVPRDRDVVVADVGAGAGLLGDVLRRDRPRATYRFFEPLDPLADRLEARFGTEARLRGPEGVHDADVVTLLDVIEHVADDRELLRTVVDPMRLDGTLVVTVPALPKLWSAWDEELHHHRRYTRETLADVTRDLPFVVDELDYVFPELIPAALVRRLAGGRVGGGGDDAITEYPELPRWLDRTLWATSTASAKGRRWWPVGTSLLLAGRRR